MNPLTADEKREASLFLHALKEEGIEELLVSLAAPKTQAPPTMILSAPASSSMVKDAMVELRDQALKCTKCQELSRGRTTVVFGSGNLKAKLMFVGEAPGRDEDEQGLPFVGAAGQLLTKIIESIGIERRQVFIANVLKCRPPQNRTPEPDEIENCSPYLWKQIELIQPQIICALGTFAAQTLLKTQTSISQLRGKFYNFQNSKLICTYHPAYLLRNPGEKAKVWDDMKKIKKELETLPS
ncbi:MAG: uracil-DNA glycosylase [Candidatus Omnitrophica bacterium]|nr:uracil-DNA glycosylase [Candidatus Omnitrophota bacterium]